jgi:hypothetical protein
MVVAPIEEKEEVCSLTSVHRELIRVRVNILKEGDM